MYEDILKQTNHRTTDYPNGPWIASQLWKHLLFINYPVDEHTVGKIIPEGLEVDTFDGKAWITVLPFKIENFTVRRIPLKGIDQFLELNVRTYVRRNGKPGVYFFRLDAEKIMDVFGARFATLTYYNAEMEMTKGRNSGTYHYLSRRKSNRQVVFEATFRPSEKTRVAEEGSLTKWLADRYFLFSECGKSIFEGPIHHRAWRVAEVDVELKQNQMLPTMVNDAILGEPYCFYAYQKRALFWPFKNT